MEKIVFKKPFVFEGIEYKDVELDFDLLNGKSMIEIEKILSSKGIMTVQFEASKFAQMYLGAKAMKQPIEFIENLPINEASKITMKVQAFLLGVEF